MSATGNHSLFLVEAKKSPQLWPRGRWDGGGNLLTRKSYTNL